MADCIYTKTIELSKKKLAAYIVSYWREVAGYLHFGNIGISSWLELSNYLIEPISEYLLKADLIYFVPYGLLHYVPLHALELNGEPLIKSHAVVYCPSASVLQFCENKGSGSLKSCASFGVVFENEAKSVAQIFNTKPHINATKTYVLENIHNDVLHFSCHGHFDTVDPLASGVVLYDDVLSAREIFNLKLNSELVTLSACQTGLNQTRQGDEIVGLTRALIYAGVSSVIVSLWSVDARATEEFMLAFYKHLKNGKDSAIALQEAQKQMMGKEEYSHPKTKF